MTGAKAQLLQTTGLRNWIELIGRIRVTKTTCGLVLVDDQYEYNFDKRGKLVDQTTKGRNEVRD
jgi:hypothetical protein